MADLPNIDFNRIEIPKFPKLPRATVAAIIAGLVVVLTGFSTLYQVQPEEVGVVLRFGRYVRTTEPGLRAQIPFAVKPNRCWSRPANGAWSTLSATA